jgi:hypothetical protein
VAPVFRGHEVVAHRHVVHVDTTVDDAHGVAFFGDDALDERLVRVERVVEHHDVAALRRGEAIAELVDDQPILIGQRRRHALAFDARDLEAERDDQRRVHGGRRERPDPREELVAPHFEPAHHLLRVLIDLQRQRRRRAGPRERIARGLEVGRRVFVAGVREDYSFRYSRSRRVCDRLTGISVAFASLILRR